MKFNILVRTILLVSCISNLFTSWHCLLKSQSILHGYLLRTYRCGIRIFSAMVWSQGGADYTASTFPEHSVPVTHEGYLVESRRPLWFGSSQANRSVFNTLRRHLPLVAVSRSTSIISLHLASRASLFSPFSSSCYIGSHCSAFLSCLLSNSGYMI